MSSPDMEQGRADVEIILQEVTNVLSDIIDEYRKILMEYSDDVMSGKLRRFCEEMEGLKHYIENNSHTLVHRIERVGDIAGNISIFLQKEGVSEEVNANIVKRDFSHLKEKILLLIGIKYQYQSESDQFKEANQPINDEQPGHEKYFRQKKLELDEIMAKYPALR
jgi:hypothetical protein